MICKTLLRFSVLLAIAVFSLSSCGVYTFTGATIPPEAKTVSIANFPDLSALGSPGLSSDLTNALKDKFSRQTPLMLVTTDGDLAFEGEIRTFTVAPVSITGDQQTQSERLTIGVRVVYQSRFEPKNNFDKSFSAYADYNSLTESFESAQSRMVEEIIEQLVENIFNESVARW